MKTNKGDNMVQAESNTNKERKVKETEGGI
jgi:hypothetical protein